MFRWKDINKKINIVSKEDFDREYQCIFEGATKDGYGFISVDKNGNIKHISNDKIFKEEYLPYRNKKEVNNV